DPWCNEVTVRNVPLEWDLMREVIVIYDYQPCEGDSIKISCRLFFRFVDSQGKPVITSSFQLRSPHVETFTADEYGRVLVAALFDRGPLVGSVSAPGFQSMKFSIPCMATNSLMEQTLTLKRGLEVH